MKLTYNPIFKTMALVAIICFSSCYKDHSNNGLTEINQIGVTDIKAATVITVYQGDILTLKPTLTQSLQGKDLEYSWLQYSSNGNISLAAPRSIIANDYELKLPISPDQYILGEPYVLRFQVKDKESGVTYYLNYNIVIGNKYGNGWLVLEDKAGKGDLSFIYPDSTVEHNFYTSRNPTAPITGPKKLELTPFSITEDISAPGKRLYILADNGSQEYNYLTMAKKFDIASLFYQAPAVIKPQSLNWLSTTAGASKLANISIMINNGKAHSNLVGGFPGVKRWGDIALTPAGNTNYSLAPFSAGGPNVAGLVYDNTSKRFYSIVAYSPTPAAGSLTPFANTVNSTAFDMNNVGLTEIFQDSSDVVHNYNAVMKDDANQLYLLRFKTVNTSTATPNLSVSKATMNAPGMLNFTAAAGSTNTGHIYYSNSNVLSRYEISSNSVVETYAFPANEQVTAIKFAKFNLNDKATVKLARLVVATWNGTEGKLYYFALSQTGAIGSYTKQFTGFGKVVDMAYKY
ncbi:PKD-like family lipoprotein [Pedobacter sp. PWIIR3]